MISAISVKDRLKNRAIATGKTMQETLTAYGLERTVYRLSVSEYKDRFTLKGGIFLYALFDGEFVRATRDIDLLAKNIPNNLQDMRNIFEKIFAIESDDALKFDPDTLDVKSITEFKEYHGVNVSIIAYLDRTKIPVSIDIGFGDIIYPDRIKMDFPVLLNMETPQVYAYSIYSVISEKFEAIVSLGIVNSRYKDFYDIYILASNYELDSKKLKEAILEPFKHRGTKFNDIVAFEEEFAKNELHNRRWNSFIRKKHALINVEFTETLALLKTLLIPIIDSINNGYEPYFVWDHTTGNWKQQT